MVVCWIRLMDIVLLIIAFIIYCGFCKWINYKHEQLNLEFRKQINTLNEKLVKKVKG